MKKVFLCAALMIGCVVFANARFTINEPVTVEVTSGDYKEVPLEDLSQIVQDAVKNLAGEVYDVAKVEFDAEKELTKVTLANKEDKSEKVVVLNKEGKEVEDETPAKE